MAFVKLGDEYLKTPVRDEMQFVHIAADTISDFVVCKSPHKLKSLLDKIVAGKTIHYVSDGDWSMHDLTMELIKQYKPVELFITSYALREFPVRQLILSQERKEIIALNMLLDIRAKARTPEVFHLASINANNIRLTSIHAKVTVIRSTAGCVSIVTSANWTQNPRIECGTITLDNDVAAFHINWIQKVMDNAEIFE